MTDRAHRPTPVETAGSRPMGAGKHAKRGVWSSTNRQYTVLFAAAVMAFSMWFFVDRIWAPQVEMHFSDLYPRWYGSRELLLHHRNPYDPSVTREIQLWSYGRPVDPRQPSGPQDEDRFAYPLYIAFLLAPTIGFQFEQVAAIFRYVLPGLAIASADLWLIALVWRPSRP